MPALLFPQHNYFKKDVSILVCPRSNLAHQLKQKNGS